MTVEPEFFIIAFVVLTASIAVGIRNGDFWRALADLTTINAKTDKRGPAKRSGPVLLAVATPVVFEPAKAPHRIETAPSDGVIRRDNATQLNRIAQIVNGAIETAGRAKRLHVAAHEQVDSAHYALQNLLDELSAVMPMATLIKSARPSSVALITRATAGPSTVTALAA